MQELLADPHTIPFFHAGAINLHSLKQEIDRRILKIRSLVAGHPPLPPPPPPRPTATYEAACQTDAHRGESSNNVRLRHRRVLSSHDSNLPVEVASICQERPSLPNRKKSSLKQNEGTERGNFNLRVRVTDYLTSKKGGNEVAAFPSLSASTDGKENEVLRSREDKVFTAVEFQLHNSYKTLQSMRECPHQFLIRNPTTESLACSEESDNEGTEGRKSFSTVARKLASVRKTKFTERTSLPEAARITASEDCVARMEEELQRAVGRKRKEPTDNKLRANVIKKVEEKYGEYYAHF